MASQLTRLEFVTKTADMLGRSLTGTTRSGATHQSILEEMYEWVQMRIARSFMFPEMDVRDTTTADTVDGTSTYSFTTLFGASARVRDILSIVIEDGTSSNRLKYKVHSNLLKRFPYPEGETERKPVWYTRIGNNLLFFPTPDAAYDIHSVHSKYPTRATGDSSTSDYDYCDDVIINGIAAEYFRHLQEKEEASYFDGQFKLKLTEASEPYIHPTDWEPEGRAFNSAELTPGDFWKDPLQFTNI